MLHYQNLQLYLRLGLKHQKIRRVLEFNQLQWLKPYVEFNTQKRIEAGKNEDKDGKTLHKLMNKAVHGIMMKKSRNKIDLRLTSNKKS